MGRFFIELSYRGTAYHGWQRQPNATTVQQTIEEALSKLLGESCEIVGCGRTDTGVHSSHYVAHFDYAGDRVNDEKFTYRLNAILPRDIAVHKIYPSAKHARFDATSRQYKYVIGRTKNPFSTGLAWQYTAKLNIEAMQRAADRLLCHSDFSSFEKLHSDNKTSLCTITKAKWEVISEQQNDETLVFTITADRFLRGMIRLIVGTLVSVGKGIITVEEFDEIIRSRDVRRASSAAPSDGLFLSKIEY